MFFRKPSDHVPHVTIFHTILRSMLWILFIEIALLVGILYLCRINTSLEQNAVDILQIQTENRQNYLQGQMLDAQDLSSLADKINAVTQAMLDVLRAKHPVRALRLLCADYFAVDFGRAAFDAAVSFESLHHFPAERKRALYRRVCEALRPGGVFLLGDYMVETEAEAEDLARRAAQLRAEAGTPDAAIVHLDTPLTVETEKALLLQAGFSEAACLLRKGNTTLLRAQRA